MNVVSLGLLVWPVQGVRVTVLLASAVLTLAATLGVRWQSRGRAARRRNAALEAYADREIARARSRKAAKRDRSLPPGGPPMNGEWRPLADGDTVAEALAAELTSAAYTVALRRGLGGSWISLELGLWRALADTVEKWSRKSPPAGSPDEVARWQEAFLEELTESAVSIALEQGVKGPPLEVELRLFQALRSVIQRAAQAEP